MLTLACKKEYIFLRRRPTGPASYRKTPVLESLFNSKYCKVFKSTYFEEHLRTVASENVFMKLRKIKIYKEF